MGDLTGFTRAEATLDPEPGAVGYVIAVARDQAGGTAWTIATTTVAP